MTLLNEKGRKLDVPFLEVGEELWDPTGTRLTLLLDPGRIKRGLKPREDLGPILEAGSEVHTGRRSRLARRDGPPVAGGIPEAVSDRSCG